MRQFFCQHATSTQFIQIWPTVTTCSQNWALDRPGSVPATRMTADHILQTWPTVATCSQSTGQTEGVSLRHGTDDCRPHPSDMANSHLMPTELGTGQTEGVSLRHGTDDGRPHPSNVAGSCHMLTELGTGPTGKCPCDTDDCRPHPSDVADSCHMLTELGTGQTEGVSLRHGTDDCRPHPPDVPDIQSPAGPMPSVLCA